MAKRSMAFATNRDQCRSRQPFCQPVIVRSGVLPGIDPNRPPGKKGSADRCSRLILFASVSRCERESAPITKPKTRPRVFTKLAARVIAQKPTMRPRNQPFQYSAPMPNRQDRLKQPGPVSPPNFVGFSYDWPRGRITPLAKRSGSKHKN